MNQRTEQIDNSLVCVEGWIVPEIVTPEYVDLCLQQLGQMWDANPGRAAVYQSKLYYLVLESIANYKCINIQLCCEIVTECDKLWRSNGVD